MSFRIGSNKPARPPPPKGKGGLSLGGFSFKQLEEDEEEEEDLSLYTGKYDKILDESQKSTTRPFRENRLASTSSNSSTSSAPEELKSYSDKIKNDIEVFQKSENDSNLKPTMNSSDSPFRKTAKAKLESSKELFSGLKGKITDKISKTIEDFSVDPNSSPSPESEKQKESPLTEFRDEKEVPIERSNSFGPIVKETVPILQATPVTELNHPLAGGDEELERKEDGKEDGALTEPPGNDDVDVFHDPEDKREGNTPEDILVMEEHFTSDTQEDFMSIPALSTSTKLKPHSKIKQLIPKKSSKTSAVASMSGLSESPSAIEEVISSFGGDLISAKKNEKISDNISEKCDISKEVKAEKTKTVEKMDKSQVLSSSKQADSSELKEDTSPSPTQSKSMSVLRQLSTDYAALPYSKAFGAMVAVFAYLIIPMPSFVSGLIFGILLASLGWAVYMWLVQPPHPVEPLVLPPVEVAPPPVPLMKQTIPTDEHIYKGWMNEAPDYNVDEYHINKTHSIYVSLEGMHLRIQRPKNPAPKRAMWDETLTKPQFIHQRHFDLPGSKVFLSPPGLVKKRIWSKKYPICISLHKPLSNTGTHRKDVPGLKHASSDPLLEDKNKDKELSEMGFEVLSGEKCNSHILFLFARTGREKEEWFKRFSAAAHGKPLGNHIVEMKQVVKEHYASLYGGPDGTKKLQRESSTDSVGSVSSQADGQNDVVTPTEGSELLNFSQYMGRLMPTSSASSSRASSPTHSSASSLPSKDGATTPTNLKLVGSQDRKDETIPKVMSKNSAIICDNQLFWLNALIGRCFFDFLRDKWWIGKVTEKLQKKLSKIHVPYFIEELQVSSIEMGYEIPAIRNAGRPYMDERGFWVELDVTYSGGFKMTIETKMNLMKLKKQQHSSHSVDHSVDRVKSPITDSEEEDSAESSTDEEEEIVAEDNSASGGGTSKKFMRYLNKITQSRYFQQATEYKVVRRAMENVSNTPLTLTVTVNSLVGKLAVNIPPPPSDRLWYGFRGNPRLRLSAKPQVGERAVTFTHITDWIEKKLAVEFQRVFVMPNMDDLVIPILVPGEVNGTAMAHSMSL